MAGRVLIDLNDRHAWYGSGMAEEERFCELFGSKFKVKVNPDKDRDPCLPDLLHASGKLCELKTRHTPFFTAYKTYRVPIQKAVTINRNDMERYLEHYPDMPIFFWVQWSQLEWHNIKVNPMHGVWGIRVNKLANLCTDKRLHQYQGRVDDEQGNAKDSYVVTLNEMRQLWLA